LTKGKRGSSSEKADLSEREPNIKRARLLAEGSCEKRGGEVAFIWVPFYALFGVRARRGHKGEGRTMILPFDDNSRIYKRDLLSKEDGRLKRSLLEEVSYPTRKSNRERRRTG